MASFALITILTLTGLPAPATFANHAESTLRFLPYERAPIQTMKVWITAYSSTPEETDDSPFITASGTRVRDGIVATNLLPFGTKIKIPQLFGDKIFVVEDRMHRRKTNHVDVWMPTKSKAKRFGIAHTEVAVVELALTHEN